MVTPGACSILPRESIPLVRLSSNHKRPRHRRRQRGSVPHCRVRCVTCRGNLRLTYSVPLSDHNSAVNSHMNDTRSASGARTKLSSSLEIFFNVVWVRIIFMSALAAYFVKGIPKSLQIVCVSHVQQPQPHYSICRFNCPCTQRRT